MRKVNVTKILTIISVIIIGLGIIYGIGLSNSIDNSIPQGSMYVDGSDFSGIVQITGIIGSKIIGTLIVFGGFVIAAFIWLIYGFILLIINIVKKIKNMGVEQDEQKINPNLLSYVEKEIFPIYETFDKGHDINHILAVIKRALSLAENFDDLDINVVYAAAALHDIGIKVQRKNHAYYSKLFVEENEKLKEFFNEDQIKIIADAVEDHSTSKGIEPRTIYGKIVCDADKDDDLETSLLRAYEFTKKYYEDYTEQECIANVYNQLKFKFGEEGKVKFWINTKEQQEFLNKMKQLAANENLFYQYMNEIIEKHSFQGDVDNVQKSKL